MKEDRVPSQAGGAEVPRQGRMRADARRNRARILSAACDAFVERGVDAPLDDIARRAGVGIATLYRRFPDRAMLLREVALELLRRSADEAGAALAEEPDAFQALCRYMHRALDLRIAAVMPALVGRIEADEDVVAARQRSTRRINRIIDAAHAAKLLRPDAAPGDIGLLIVRLSRPLPGPFPAAVNQELAHRHLDLLLDGLRSTRATALPGPAMTFDDLAAMPLPDPGARTGS
jgi:AcrR family transcriptional regulator